MSPALETLAGSSHAGRSDLRDPFEGRMALGIGADLRRPLDRSN